MKNVDDLYRIWLQKHSNSEFIDFLIAQQLLKSLNSFYSKTINF